MPRVWDVPVRDSTRVRDARVAAEGAAALAGLDERRTAAAALVATELATNLLKHAEGGQVLIDVVDPPAPREGRARARVVQITAIDHGPGIADVPAAVRDGFSTTRSLGAGLGTCLRLADDFGLHSTPGRGTVAVARVGMTPRGGAVTAGSAVTVWADGVSGARGPVVGGAEGGMPGPGTPDGGHRGVGAWPEGPGSAAGLWPDGGPSSTARTEPPVVASACGGLTAHTAVAGVAGGLGLPADAPADSGGTPEHEPGRQTASGGEPSGGGGPGRAAVAGSQPASGGEPSGAGTPGHTTQTGAQPEPGNQPSSTGTPRHTTQTGAQPEPGNQPSSTGTPRHTTQTGAQPEPGNQPSSTGTPRHTTQTRAQPEPGNQPSSTGTPRHTTQTRSQPEPGNQPSSTGTPRHTTQTGAQPGPGGQPSRVSAPGRAAVGGSVSGPSMPLVGVRAGGVNIPYGGGEYSGDAWTWARAGDRVTLMLADGLGHGPEAARASSTAVAELHRWAGLSPAEALRRLHDALRGTRGAAVAVAQVDLSAGRLRFAGIGNVGARLRADGTWRPLLSRPGIVGVHQPTTLREEEADWAADRLLILHTDGLPSRWTPPSDADPQAADPAVTAAVTIRDASSPARPVRDDTAVAVLTPTPPDRP